LVVTELELPTFVIQRDDLCCGVPLRIAERSEDGLLWKPFELVLDGAHLPRARQVRPKLACLGAHIELNQFVAARVPLHDSRGECGARTRKPLPSFACLDVQ